MGDEGQVREPEEWIGPYQIRHLLGRGATDVASTRFLRDGRAVHRVVHSSVVEVFGVGEHEGVPSAAAAAHDVGVVRRNLTPSNIRLTRDRAGARVPIVLDFGISKIGDEPGPEPTQSDGVLGTGPHASRAVAVGEARQGNARPACFLHEGADPSAAVNGSAGGRLALAGRRKVVLGCAPKRGNEIPETAMARKSGVRRSLVRGATKELSKLGHEDLLGAPTEARTSEATMHGSGGALRVTRRCREGRPWSTTRVERRACFVARLLIASLMLGAPRAAAQAESEAAARALFEEGRRLIKNGDYAGACPKVEAAARLHASPGVLLNLGDCYEHANRTASAWAEFAEAEAMAARADRADMQVEANRRKALLEPKLCRLIIHVTESVPGLAIARDGLPVNIDVSQAPVPIDPGEHIVMATAPQRIRWSTTVTLTEAGDVVVVEVPKLQEASRPSVPVSTPKPDAPVSTTWRVAGAATFGIGILALGAGGILAFSARSRETEAEREIGMAQISDSLVAVHEGNAATAFVIGGAVLGLVGIVLWATAPTASSRVTTTRPPLILEGAF